MGSYCTAEICLGQMASNAGYFFLGGLDTGLLVPHPGQQSVGQFLARAVVDSVMVDQSYHDVVFAGTGVYITCNTGHVVEGSGFDMHAATRPLTLQAGT